MTLESLYISSESWGHQVPCFRCFTPALSSIEEHYELIERSNNYEYLHNNVSYWIHLVNVRKHL